MLIILVMTVVRSSINDLSHQI